MHTYQGGKKKLNLLIQLLKKKHWCQSECLSDDLSSTPPHAGSSGPQRGGAEFDPQGHSSSLALFQLFEAHVQRHLISFGCISRETESDVALGLPADGNRSNHKTADIDPQRLSQLQNRSLLQESIANSPGFTVLSD